MQLDEDLPIKPESVLTTSYGAKTKMKAENVSLLCNAWHHTPLSECLQRSTAGKLTRSQLCAMCQWRKEHGPIL